MKSQQREIFRQQVFERDNHKCVNCGDKAVDAHHILERRLFDRGGYHVDNGASLCSQCHLLAEKTDLSVEDLREKCKILKPFLPEHLYQDNIYDKWGNIILHNGSRTKGELFYDESVQKILKDKLDLFTNYTKYPRTYHLPWSENKNKDDKNHSSTVDFNNQNVIVTEKMDGQNTTMYSNYIHARSIDGRSHESMSWVKNYHRKIAHEIPENFRICGENLFAKHSIKYNNLQNYFLGFSIWEKDTCLSWQDTLDYFNLLNIVSVPILYEGIFNKSKIHNTWLSKRNWENSEGYIIRISDEFKQKDFSKFVGKYVRKDHIQTNKHWLKQKLEKNILRKNNEK